MEIRKRLVRSSDLTSNFSLSHLFPYLSFLLIILIFTPLLLRIENNNIKHVPSINGTWDLSDASFTDTIYYLGRPFEILEGFHTPEEFTRLQNQVILSHGNFPNTLTYRILVHLPDDIMYTFTKTMTGDSYKLFVNGTPMACISDDRINHNSSRITITATPVNGVVEIIHQITNGSLLNPDYYENWFVGNQMVLSHLRTFDYLQSIIIGCFLILTVIFLFLSILQLCNWKSTYKNQTFRFMNIYFALFSLLWGVRTGLTGSAILLEMVPMFTWMQRTRGELVLIACTVVLLIFITNELFHNIVSSFFRWYVIIMNVIFIILFAFAPITQVRVAVGSYILFSTIISLYLLIQIILHLRSNKTDVFAQYQLLFLIGYSTFSYLLIRNTLNYLGLYVIPPIRNPEELVPHSVEMLSFNIIMLVMALLMATSIFFEADRIVRSLREAASKHDILIESYQVKERLQSELIATISHEARTPLAVLSSYSMMIAMELKALHLDEDITSSLDVIVTESKRVADLIENLNKITIQNNTTEEVDFDLSDLIEQVVTLYKRAFNSENIEFDSHIEDHLFVFGFPEQMSQVLFNLLQNAKNNTTSGKISVFSKRVEHEIVTEVIDTGCGISRQDLPKVWNKGFSRCGSSGLGLFLCKEILSQHKGSVDIFSELDQGTHVVFRLPFYEV